MDRIIDIVLAGVSTAMGVVVLVLSLIGDNTSTETFITFLGIGLFCLGVRSLKGLPKSSGFK